MAQLWEVGFGKCVSAQRFHQKTRFLFENWVWGILGPKMAETGSGMPGFGFLAKNYIGEHQDRRNPVLLSPFRGQIPFLAEITTLNDALV